MSLRQVLSVQQRVPRQSVINASIWLVRLPVNIIVAGTNGYPLHMFSKLPIKQLEFKHESIKE